MNENLDDALTILLDIGRSEAGPQVVEGGNVPYVLVPAGSKVQPVPELIFNEHRETPERIKQTVKVLDPDSFVRYYKLFSDSDSRVFADETTLRVSAVLDYHTAALAIGPRWGQHKADLNLVLSEPWKIWLGSNNKHLTQTEFSEFLEQNSMDITNPSAATVREICGDLQATTEVEFASGVRMQDGQIRFKYTESTKATMKGAQLDVPERFTIGVPVFVGGEDVSLDALLRFRVKEQKLSFWYTLVRPEDAKRTAFQGARAKIAADLGIDIINGSLAIG